MKDKTLITLNQEEFKFKNTLNSEISSIDFFTVTRNINFLWLDLQPIVIKDLNFLTILNNMDYAD